MVVTGSISFPHLEGRYGESQALDRWVVAESHEETWYISLFSFPLQVTDMEQFRGHLENPRTPGARTIQEGRCVSAHSLHLGTFGHLA